MICTGVGVENKKFSLIYTKFELPSIQLIWIGLVHKEMVNYVSLEFKGEVWAGNINVGALTI